MQHYKKPWRGWGALVSVALHLSVAFLLLFRLTEALPKPPEETIKVEVVPPAPPKPPEKSQNKPAESKPQPAAPLSPPPPQAFQSALAKTDEKVIEPQLPPEEQEAPQSADSTPQDASPAKPQTETKPPAEKAPSATQPDLPKLDLPVTDRGDVPRKDEAPTAQQVADAKALAQSQKAPAQNKPAESKSGKQKPLKLARAKKLFSPDALSDPRVRQAIGNLPINRRIMELCNVEAMAQVRNQRPDADLLAYSPSSRTIASGTLSSRVGAFRNRSNWYNLDFKCQVDAAAMEVVSFSFGIGNAVPRSDWPARKLPVD
ncbi:outer membrane biosynthesis protein TonB [Phyllobacterium sp. 1468]|uniref:DUF930 domain-containing protein n=1 Tax=Phyllobacterium sp. 1468 TaxID=2817759 RepID=UPI002863FBE4|nr:DUF930 domain-containing protein [Phyllobacterium sp. 1468]MDR6634741.1 outer membrane biosynthesis protein TonB [Phyllobacterium sp. 1468]